MLGWSKKEEKKSSIEIQSFLRYEQSPFDNWKFKER